MFKRRLPLQLAAAVLSGLLLAAAGEPLGLAPLAWVALAPLFWASLTAKRARQGALCGFACGVAYFGIHLAWIFRFGWMAWTGLVAALAAFTALAGAAATVFRRFPLAPVLAAGAWVGAELARDRWPWGGFGWGAAGVTQGSVPGVRWLAGSIGTFGLSFLVAFVGAVVADRLATGRCPWGSVALVGAALVLFAGVDALRYGAPPRPRLLRVAVAQGSVPRPVVPDQDRRVLEGELAVSAQLRATARRPHVLVWPESALGVDAGPDALARAQEVARSLGVPMLVGRAVALQERRAFLNLVDHLDARGQLVATYQKRHPVPFGEYVPLGFLRRYVSTLGQVPFDMVPGGRTVVFEVGGVRIGVPICFESAFPRDVRAFARAGAELIVVSTNNSSFERSPASRQHLAHSRMRALELRQWVVQAALSGITAVVGPDGEISHRTRLFERVLVVAEVGARPARTLYARVGDLFSYAWAGGTGVAGLLYAGVLAWGRRRVG